MQKSKNVIIENDLFVELMPDPVAIIDHLGRIVNVNQKTEILLGYKKNEIINKLIINQSFLPPETKTILLQNFLKRMLGGKIPPYEVTFLDKKNNKILLEINGSKVNINGKNFDLAVFRDVTERKANEKKLNEEKEFSSNIVEHAPIIILALGEKSIILTFNKFAEKVTGWKSDEVIGKNWIEKFIPKHNQSLLESIWDDIVKKQKIGHVYENTIITKNGVERLIRWNNSTHFDQDNNFKMIISLGEDITDIKKSETNLMRRNEELERFKSLTVGRELSMVELKNKVTELEEKLKKCV